MHKHSALTGEFSYSNNARERASTTDMHAGVFGEWKTRNTTVYAENYIPRAAPAGLWQSPAITDNDNDVHVHTRKGR